jgi:hypothetical protein
MAGGTKIMFIESIRRTSLVGTLVALTCGLTAACSSGTGGEFGGEPTGETSSALNNHLVQVGTRCQEDYQNGWQVDVGNNDVWNRCYNFQNTMAGFEVNAFYYNLHGAQAALQNTDTCGWPCGYADAADFFYMNTHGGSNSSTAFWAMWDQNSFARTQNMRLGNSGRENMVLATFSCSTHLTDSNQWNRWFHTFAGGMYVTVGGHGTMYSGNDQSATDFANRMSHGEAIAQSFLESSWYADNSNTPTGIATGANSTDCYNRLGITLDTLFGNTPLRDSSIGYMCWSSWN